MRLTPQQRQAILAVVHRYDPHARVGVFGSRLDPARRGGDIDLLIHSDRLNRTLLREIRLDLQDVLGEQHFDLVVHGASPGAFARAAAREEVPL